MDKFHEKPWLIKTDLYIKCEQSWITKRNWAYNLKPLGSEGLIRKSTDISISVIFYSFKNHYSKGIIFPVCVCITYCYLPVLTFYHLDVVCVCVSVCVHVCVCITYHYLLVVVVVQLPSCVQLFVTPMDCSTLGLSVPHHLLTFAQVHGGGIQLSHPLMPSSPSALKLAQQQGLFQWVSCPHQMTKILEFQLQHQSFQWIFRVDLP